MCGCDKNKHQKLENPCCNCKGDFEGYYTAEGERYNLLNGKITVVSSTRTYLITKVGDNMYKVVINNLTPIASDIKEGKYL